MEVSRESLVRLTAIARAAGVGILQHYSDSGRSEPDTGSDIVSHRIISGLLSQWDPDLPVVFGELLIAEDDVPRRWPRFWFVDPLSGTPEPLARNHDFTVNIALIDRGEPVWRCMCLCVQRPVLRARGLGAWKERGAVSPSSRSRRTANTSPSKGVRGRRLSATSKTPKRPASANTWPQKVSTSSSTTANVAMVKADGARSTSNHDGGRVSRLADLLAYNGVFVVAVPKRSPTVDARVDVYVVAGERASAMVVARLRDALSSR